MGDGASTEVFPHTILLAQTILPPSVYNFTVLVACEEVTFVGVLRVEEQLGNRCEKVWREN